MRALLIGLLSGMAMASANALADAKAGEALAKKDGCFVCHAVDSKLVGPSYKEVAAKYKGDKSAEAKLVEKVKKAVPACGGRFRCLQIPLRLKTRTSRSSCSGFCPYRLPLRVIGKAGFAPAFLFASQAITAN